MVQHCGQLSSRVMDSLWHVDKDGFMRFLAGTSIMCQRRCIPVYLWLESMELVGHIKASSERNNRIGKEKLSAKDISSEGYCWTIWSSEHEKWLKKSNYECFLYMSLKFKRKHQWSINNTKRVERKHIQVVLHLSTS